ncbi:MAG TPA: hypothetical protein PLB89_07075 [Flavobacteriales bacterium]|nr:hypothetical protein [Flavobacteriales bacterium]
MPGPSTMPTGTHDQFSPRGALTADQLKAYAEGRMGSSEQHAVELHAESDPLVREALDGLMQPGAMAGLKELDRARPQHGSGSSFAWIAGAVMVALIIGSLLYSLNKDQAEYDAAVIPEPTKDIAALPEMAQLDPVEITNAVEIAETLHIGHAATERHALPMREQAVAREETPIERLDRRSIGVDSLAPPSTLRPERVKKQSRQLIYLHDLKLVHPKELYPMGPNIADDQNVSARFTDSQAQHTGKEEQRMMQYTAFMDDALDKFVQNDHKGCLEELRFLLKQYPDDVNALFYAGLCSYNLGLNARAKEFLHRAATHPVDVFDEEAQWYHALTLERLREIDRAREAFERIAAQGGFYAERAKGKLPQSAP